MSDSLGDRMKKDYEDRFRILLPRRTYLLMRLDGVAFHSFTKKFDKPFDKDFIEAMNKTTEALCHAIAGAKFGFVQSDEISILVTDFEKSNTDAWFDNNLQKIVSVSASTATINFNKFIKEKKESIKSDALFDSRVWTITDPIEVINYFIWRQQDCSKNSIQMLARSLYSHKELHGKNCSDLQELCFQKGHNWNDCPTGFKRGRVIRKVDKVIISSRGRDIKKVNELVDCSEVNLHIRRKWETDLDIPIFTQDKSYLNNLIPQMRVLDE